MKKKTIMCIVVLIVAAIVSATVVSCKKDKDEVVTKNTNSEVQTLLKRVNDFQTLRDAVNSGAKADGSMTVEEMRQALDLVSNYEHSEHMTYCLSTVLDTLHLVMPAVDGEGLVSEADAVATYNAFETALEKCMLGVKDGMDVPSYFSIVMPKAGAKDDDDINIVFFRGAADEDPCNEKHTSEGPYTEEDNWYWGLDLGPCDQTGYTGRMIDAADKLTQQFGVLSPGQQHSGQSYIVYNVEHAGYAPCETSLLPGYIYYVDPNMEDCAATWLFYHEGSDEPCISYDELNCYWRSIRRNIVLPFAPLHYGPVTNSPYHICTIEDRVFYRRTKKVHLANVVYCQVSWAEPILPPID